MAVLRTWRSTCLAYLESATSRLASPIIISPVHSAGTPMFLFRISRCVPGHVLSPISCLKKPRPTVHVPVGPWSADATSGDISPVIFCSRRSPNASSQLPSFACGRTPPRNLQMARCNFWKHLSLVNGCAVAVLVIRSSLQIRCGLLVEDRISGLDTTDPLAVRFVAGFRQGRDGLSDTSNGDFDGYTARCLWMGGCSWMHALQ
ncbi:hypothetical protein F5144DRAFT_192102 [Chaetomium tenue]|uniref:Uncharacterized protein n=1 Tax=Chaetomium tenue TaxID=1854479 RepID=A0ACB7PD78_9PEZI|nr:hypothetical protein F5144DRAFT_192102 [Chaetomium globosum]